MLPIAESLVQTGQWEFCEPARPRYPDELNNIPTPKVLLEMGIRKPTPQPARPHSSWADGTWLIHIGDQLGPNGLGFLHFCSEDQYQLSIGSCLELEAPDLWARLPVILENEYYRDPHRRFGPYTWESAEDDLRFYAEVRNEENYHTILRADIMSRSPSVTIPIFIPSVSAHMNALLRQAQHAKDTGRIKDLDILGRLHRYVEKLYLDWDQTAKWFLSTKITESNRKFMENLIQTFGRRPEYVYDKDAEKLPWEEKSQNERGVLCDERCGYCKVNEER